MVYINEGREDNFLNVLIKIIQKFFNKFDPTAKFCLTFVVGNCSRLRKFKRTIVRGYVRCISSQIMNKRPMKLTFLQCQRKCTIIFCYEHFNQS